MPNHTTFEATGPKVATHREGLFTSEAVSAGHPDKVCDRISDAVLDAALAQDPNARVAVESAIKGHDLFVFGEVTANADLDYEAVARAALTDIGYDDPAWGLDLGKLNVRLSVSEQASEIAGGVGAHDDPGAGDQGMMFGYACDDTPELMPLTIALAQQLITHHQALRVDDRRLGPDAKSQVTVRYEHGKPVSVDAVVLSTQHAEGLSLEQLREFVREALLKPVLGDWLTDSTQLFINPAGTFVIGGPAADAGLTGRKIIVDTYGGMAPHGGGAFSGKDPTKVDRSAAYGARQIARHAVDRGWASECLVRVAYAIGEASPVAVAASGDGRSLERQFEADGLDLRALLRPGSIIRRQNLRRPIYAATAAGGHFGRAGFPWEEPLSADASAPKAGLVTSA